MMILCILFLVIGAGLQLCGEIFMDVEDKDKYCHFLTCIGAALISIASFIIFYSYLNKDAPTAMDVYNDKTKMSITYQDSIPIDTVIVYKEPQEFDWWTLKNK